MLLHDLRSAVRQLVRAPHLSLVAILSLALATGATMAVWTVIEALVYRELPVPEPHRLVRLAAQDRTGRSTGFTLSAFSLLQRQQPAVVDVFGYSAGAPTIEINGTITRAAVNAVTREYFDILGIRPVIGRPLGPSDVGLSGPPSAPVAVLGHQFWQRHFDGDPGVLGKTVDIEGIPFTVIGVTPEAFLGLEVDVSTDLTIPITWLPRLLRLEMETGQIPLAEFIGRLREGVTREEARAHLAARWPGVLRATVPATASGPQVEQYMSRRLVVSSAATGGSRLRGRLAQPLAVVFGIAGWMLLIACVNLAGVFVARAAARERELAVRRALGASRLAMVRQAFAEILLLCGVGTVAGLPLAWWGSHALANWFWTGPAPLALDLTPGWPTVAMIGGVAVVTGLVVGLVPAWTAARAEASLAPSIARITAPAARRTRALLVVQVACSVVMLSGAGLFIKSLIHLRNQTPGFRTDGVLLANLFPQPGGYDGLDDARYYRDLLERLSTIPGVESAALMRLMPAGESRSTQMVARAAGSGDESVTTATDIVSPGYFSTLGIPLLRGRVFTWSDDGAHGRVVILSHSLAERLFPDGDALGRRIRLGEVARRQELEIVGIVADASVLDVRTRASTMAFVPLLQEPDRWPVLGVRTQGDPGLYIEAVRQTVSSLGHEYVVQALSLDEQIDRALSRERALAGVSGFFALMAALLVGLGLYGVVASTVTRRARELGLRLALGASPGRIRAMVIRQSGGIVLMGLAIGVPGAIAAGRAVAAQVHGVGASDPTVLAGVCAALLVVGSVASSRPAGRAGRIDPGETLRGE